MPCGENDCHCYCVGAAHVCGCDCPRDEPDWLDEAEEAEPGVPCWAPSSPGGSRCGLEVDHDGDHYFNIWETR